MSYLMNTPEKPTYPARFTGLCLDDVNYLLSEGRATEADAAQYVRWWNESGKRVTVAELRHYTVPFGERGMRVPHISILNHLTTP